MGHCSLWVESNQRGVCSSAAETAVGPLSLLSNSTGRTMSPKTCFLSQIHWQTLFLRSFTPISLHFLPVSGATAQLSSVFLVPSHSNHTSNKTPSWMNCPHLRWLVRLENCALLLPAVNRSLDVFQQSSFLRSVTLVLALQSISLQHFLLMALPTTSQNKWLYQKGMYLYFVTIFILHLPIQFQLLLPIWPLLWVKFCLTKTHILINAP